MKWPMMKDFLVCLLRLRHDKRLTLLEEKDGNGSALTAANATMNTHETSRSDGMAALMDFSSPIRTPKLPFKSMLMSQSTNPDFFGRTQVLKQINDVLHPPERQFTYSDTHDLRSFTLCGFGGIGKTQIAIQYAYSQIHLYDAIFWIQADGADKLANSFRNIAIGLQLIRAAEASDPVVNRNSGYRHRTRDIRHPMMTHQMLPRNWRNG